MVSRAVPNKQRLDVSSINNLVIAFWFTVWLLTRAVYCEDLCTERSDNGVYTQDCSQRGLAKFPEQLSEKAQVLDFSNNKLTSIPLIKDTAACNETYTCHPAVCRTNITFSGNVISNVANHAFDGLRCLRTFDLSFNRIRAEIFHSAWFQEGFFYLQKLKLNNNPLGSLPDSVITQPFMPDLRELDLSHCDLQEVNNNSIDDFSELRVLNLSFNKLKIIHSEAFKGHTNLEFMDLRGNQLTYFSKHSFGDLVNLKVLILADNKLVGFDVDAFYSDSTLEMLDLSNNQLTTVPYNILEKLTKLQTLDLSKNPISKVTQWTSSNKIQTLILDNMPGLTELGPDALASFPAIVNLSISGNQALESIDSKFLGENLAPLQHLRLENNKLSTLDLEALPWHQLATLNLAGNPWYCDDSLKWMISMPKVRDLVTCASPMKVKGQIIGSLSPDDLVREFSIQSSIWIIILSLSLPVLGILAVLVWRRRRHFTCLGDAIKGRYVALFQGDEQGEQRVDIQLKVNVSRLKAVSNGRADDTKPFIMLQEQCYKIDEEHEDSCDL